MGTLKRSAAKNVIKKAEAKHIKDLVITNEILKPNPKTKKRRQETVADLMKNTPFSDNSPMYFPKRRKK